ncbi:putative heavy metal-associated domain superfamily, protein PYRICULARIA ORYZAE RESISTANCE 21 [Helianthus debilis subsp. tardiflorus]
MSPEKEQVTAVMILYVDLKCPCCYKKVRKLLCKFPQIRDQVFDEEKNKVTITVVCCDPERMRDKLCCKGGKAIQSIEILDPPKPKPQPPPPAPAPKPAADPPPKLPDPPQPKVPDNPKPPPQPKKPDPVPQPQPKMPDPPQPKLPDHPKPPPQPKVPDPKPPPQPEKPDPVPPPQPKLPDPPQPEPVPIAMDPCWPPVSVCCQECYEGRGGGPCYYGYGRPVPPPPGPCYDGYGYGYGYRERAPCYVTRCDYFSEENPQGCSIM